MNEMNCKLGNFDPVLYDFRKLNNILGNADPNVYNFMNLRQRDQALSRPTLLQVLSGRQTRKRQKKWQPKDEKIRKLEQRLSNVQLNLTGFLEAVQ